MAHDAKTIHGSFSNKSKVNRMAFILFYVTKDAAKNIKATNKYENKLVNISKIKKN